MLRSDMGAVTSTSSRPIGKSKSNLNRDTERMTALIAFTARSLRTERPRPFGASIVHTRTGKPLLRALNAVAQSSTPAPTPKFAPFA